MVFFTRPGYSQLLEALTGESKMVAEAIERVADKSIYFSGQTSKEWFFRRIKLQRTKNQKVWPFCTLPSVPVLMYVVQGPETWRASRGTEHRPEAA